MGIACLCMFTKHVAFFCCSGMEIAVGLLDSMLNGLRTCVLLFCNFRLFFECLVMWVL
jgi:hypothetical protein